MPKFLPNYRQSMITKSATIKEALSAIANSGAMMACIVDNQDSLLGILTDSDIRRALLQGCSLEDQVETWMVNSPIVGNTSMPSNELLSIANSEGIREIPLVDEKGRLQDVFVTIIRQERLDIENTSTLGSISTFDNAMFILAGGKGIRLKPVVNDRPKPLALVGGRPIIQTVIQSASKFGIKKFFIAVNYLADQIISHLQSPDYQNLDIEIIKETEFLGTAGAISMIKDKITKDLLVCNADVLTKIPYDLFIKQHIKEGADLTCAIRPYSYTVPYGVVTLENERISSIQEKPSFQFLVNSGIYLLSPRAIDNIPSGQKFDMTDLIRKLIKQNMPVRPFMMHEYWLDIGQPQDYHKANEEYGQHFGEFKNEL